MQEIVKSRWRFTLIINPRDLKAGVTETLAYPVHCRGVEATEVPSAVNTYDSNWRPKEDFRLPALSLSALLL